MMDDAFSLVERLSLASKNNAENEEKTLNIVVIIIYIIYYYNYIFLLRCYLSIIYVDQFYILIITLC